MNSENASNKIVQQLIDLANMAKGLMDEKRKNWEDSFPVQEVERGEVKAVSFLGWCW